MRQPGEQQTTEAHATDHEQRGEEFDDDHCRQEEPRRTLGRFSYQKTRHAAESCSACPEIVDPLQPPSRRLRRSPRNSLRNAVRSSSIASGSSFPPHSSSTICTPDARGEIAVAFFQPRAADAEPVRLAEKIRERDQGNFEPVRRRLRGIMMVGDRLHDDGRQAVVHGKHHTGLTVIHAEIFRAQASPFGRPRSTPSPARGGRAPPPRSSSTILPTSCSKAASMDPRIVGRTQALFQLFRNGRRRERMHPRRCRRSRNLRRPCSALFSVKAPWRFRARRRSRRTSARPSPGLRCGVRNPINTEFAMRSTRARTARRPS